MTDKHGDKVGANGLTDWLIKNRPGHPTVYRVLEEAATLHDAKNAGYRSETDPLANFKQAPPVAKGMLTPLEYALVLVSKQDDALFDLVRTRKLPPDYWCVSTPDGGCNGEGCMHNGGHPYDRRGGDAMLRERLMDGIVYRALMIALMEETNAT